MRTQVHAYSCTYILEDVHAYMHADIDTYPRQATPRSSWSSECAGKHTMVRSTSLGLGQMRPFINVAVGLYDGIPQMLYFRCYCDRHPSN